MTQIILILIPQWLERSRPPATPRLGSRSLSVDNISLKDNSIRKTVKDHPIRRQSYEIINSKSPFFQVFWRAVSHTYIT